jgi:hypothetical protein
MTQVSKGVEVSKNKVLVQPYLHTFSHQKTTFSKGGFFLTFKK